MKSLLLRTLKSLLDDIQRLCPDVKGLERDFITIEARVENEGYGFLTIALPSFGKALDKAYSSGRLACPMGFKKIPRGSLPRFLSGLTSLIFDAKTGLLKDNSDAETVMNLRQITMFFKKMQLDSDHELALDLKAKTAFFTCDSSIRSLPRDRLDFYRRVTCWMLYGLDAFEDLPCKHGPGAVAESLTPNQKWSEVFRGLSDFDHRLMDSGYETSAIAFAPSLYLEVLKQQPPSGCARLVSVAKSSTSRRTITVEPALNMFIQQGLNTRLRDFIEKDSILRKCLSLTDQSKNQKLALAGSRSGKYATLDLSSASDLLSYELVKETFRNYPRFLNLADWSRSAFVEGLDGPTQIQKFAGMGNALTFPVQSTVFACICVASILWNRGKYYPTRKDVEATARRIRVYGDDIIVPTESCDQAVDWLHLFGLKVNSDKSFMKGNFRESCGVDAFKGVDITPLYLRYEPDVTSISASALEHLISLSNQLWLKCYYKTSELLKTTVESFLKRKLPLVSVNSSCLGWHNRLNAYDFTKWNRKLHRFDVKSLCGYSPVRSDQIDGYAALLKFFHTPLLGRGKNHLKETERRFNLKHRWRWVQAS